MNDTLTSLDFVTIPAGAYELGWRFTSSVPDDVWQSMEEWVSRDDLLRRFSPSRRCQIQSFSLATTTVSISDLSVNLDEAATIEEVCDELDQFLASRGMRVPHENELEAACGGGLFSWGYTVPDGIPYGDETSFSAHRAPTERGLLLNSDPYKVEVVRSVFKLGDGGESICGGYPEPIAWLSLSPSWFLTDADVEHCFEEFLEGTYIRPVLVR